MHAVRIALAGVALLAGACTAPAAESLPRLSDPGTVHVRILALSFEPRELEIPAGTSVAWQSEGVAAHDVTADDGSFASGTLQQGAAFLLTFDTPGSWAYTCTLHPEMTGVVRVR